MGVYVIFLAANQNVDAASRYSAIIHLYTRPGGAPQCRAGVFL